MLSVCKRILRDHTHNLSQILKLAKADLVKTYRGAALGWSWAVIKPCVTLFTYWFALSFGFRSNTPITVGDNTYAFFLWLVLGITPWFYMNDMLVAGTESIRKYKYLVTKMKFPVSVIPTFVSVSKLMVNLVLLLVVMILFWASGHAPTLYWVQLPVYIGFSFAFFTLWAQFASLLAAISQDFLNLVKAFITPLFWLSGIIWRADTLHEHPLIQWFLRLNPVTYLVNGFRNCMIFERWFFETPLETGIFMGWLVLLWILSLWAYKRLRKDIPDVL
ncbi:MAG: ABC transporter permease [Clostridia bacterium]|nr:ABC transporter permease [Clostridia bacterium]